MTRRAKPYEKTMNELTEELRQLKIQTKFYPQSHHEQSFIANDIRNIEQAIASRRKEKENG